jgi:hypothetical protein
MSWTACKTYVHHDYKTTRTIHPFLMDSSCLTLTTLLLSQPHFLDSLHSK